MAYIPPHKRHSKDMERPSPRPELLVRNFERNLNLRSPKPNIDRSGKIVYADRAISRWFAVGLDDNDQVPSHVVLEPVSVEEVERRVGEKPLVLVNKQLSEENATQESNFSTSPWSIITEKVMQDLLLSFEYLRDKMEHQGSETVKPTLVARICNILFHGRPSMRLENVNRSHVTESILGQLKRSIRTDFPPSYMENITKEIIPKIGVDFQEDKEIYHVKLSDKTRPDATISCKCRLKEDKSLLLYKVELNQVRQMVADISCLDKNLDLRLMLCSKRILTDLTEDEMNSIRGLINSAAIDSDVKGGLRWPLGKSSSGNRYSVVGVWHTIHKAYNNPSLRLKVRHADRYDFRTGSGEATREVFLKLKNIISELQEPKVESASISNMLEESLRLIWGNFLSCERFLK